MPTVLFRFSIKAAAEMCFRDALLDISVVGSHQQGETVDAIRVVQTVKRNARITMVFQTPI